MAENDPEDICPRPERLQSAHDNLTPMASPIYLSSVYECHDPDEADRLLGGEQEGYVYRRDGHPNADLLSEKCRQLHVAEKAAICASGMAALAAAALAHLRQGDRVVVSDQLYGRSSLLWTTELARFGVEAVVVDTCDLAATGAALAGGAKLLAAETITNPLLRVSDIGRLAALARENGALSLVDNTFAGPVVCRPLEWGVDLVVESLSKTMNGHSDVVLGLVCGKESAWGRVAQVISTWGFASSPFDCWLVSRGVGTLALRMERACQNALQIAQFLGQQSAVAQVYYPGLANHPDHELARRQFAGRFGTMVAFRLAGGASAAEDFIRAARSAPFAPSLGDLSTTLSHPASTSHRGLSDDARRSVGIDGGTIRVSVGIESPGTICAALSEGLQGVK